MLPLMSSLTGANAVGPSTSAAKNNKKRFVEEFTMLEIVTKKKPLHLPKMGRIELQARRKSLVGMLPFSDTFTSVNLNQERLSVSYMRQF